MSSRADKDKKLRRNVEINTERWIRQDQQRMRRELTQKEKEARRKKMERSAEEIDKSGKHYEVFK